MAPLTLLTLAILAVWLLMVSELLLGRLGLARAAEMDPAALPWPAPSVSVIVAARDEAEHIGAAMRTLLALDFPDLEVIAVDDRSTDGTGAILDALAASAPARGGAATGPRIRVLHVTELPPGWLGKNHALHRGAELARGDWLLFTDADCYLAPDLLRRAVGHAERAGLDHLVLGPTPTGGSPLMRVLLAYFALSFALSTRPWRATDPRRKEHIGIGAFNLVRARMLRALGGFERIRLRPDDDIKLGKLIKQAGHRQAFAEGSGLITVPWYATARGMIRGLEKNAFPYLDYSVALTVGAILLMLTLNLLPWLLLPFVDGLAFACALTVVLLSVVLCAAAAVRTLGLPAWYGLAFPLGALLMALAIANSMWRVLRDGGVRWRGTLYPLAELRANRV